MLSRIAYRAGGLTSILKHDYKSPVCIAQARSFWQRPEVIRTPDERIQDFEYAHAMFYGPDRDYKSFPHPTRPEFQPAVRLKWIPETWFQVLEPKLGVSGPYTLGIGLALYAMSKEWFVFDHHLSEIIGYWGALTVICMWKGKAIKNFYMKQDRQLYERYLENPLANMKLAATQRIDNCAEMIDQQGAKEYIHQAKRENVGLQLEGIYRARLQQVHTQVKRQLDYHLAVEHTKTAFQSKHMLDWIVNSVKKSITPQQEKDNLAKCIVELKALAAAQPKAA